MKNPRFGSNYIYHANYIDRFDTRTALKDGDEVKVVRVSGVGQVKAVNCQHIYVASKCEFSETGWAFAGMVHVNSLHTKTDYIAYLKAEIAKKETR